MLLGHVAQWIEHQIPVLRVGGSNPSMLVEVAAKRVASDRVPIALKLLSFALGTNPNSH